MIKRQTISDFANRIVGYVDLDTNTGNKTVIAFSGKIVGYYDARNDVTLNFARQIVGHGDMSPALLYSDGKNK